MGAPLAGLAASLSEFGRQRQETKERKRTESFEDEDREQQQELFDLKIEELGIQIEIRDLERKELENPLLTIEERRKRLAVLERREQRIADDAHELSQGQIGNLAARTALAEEQKRQFGKPKPGEGNKLQLQNAEKAVDDLLQELKTQHQKRDDLPEDLPREPDLLEQFEARRTDIEQETARIETQLRDAFTVLRELRGTPDLEPIAQPTPPPEPEAEPGPSLGGLAGFGAFLGKSLDAAPRIPTAIGQGALKAQQVFQGLATPGPLPSGLNILGGPQNISGQGLSDLARLLQNIVVAPQAPVPSATPQAGAPVGAIDPFQFLRR